MPTVVAKHQDSDLTPNDSKKEMVTEHAKPSAPKFVLEETKASRIGRDSNFRGLHFRKEAITQLSAAFLIEILQRDLQVGLYRAVKVEIHLPIARRS